MVSAATGIICVHVLGEPGWHQAQPLEGAGQGAVVFSQDWVVPGRGRDLGLVKTA